jgi:hypothetical protein
VIYRLWTIAQVRFPCSFVNVLTNSLTYDNVIPKAPGFASGGFIADSRHNGEKIINGSQQQFLARNMNIGSWSGGVWNQVFFGVIGAPNGSSYPNAPFTTYDTNPLSREKPYMYMNNNTYFVHVPSAKSNSRGITWDARLTDGRTIPLSHFYIAKPSDSVRTINLALMLGKHLLLTPGLYTLRKAIVIRKANTVVLGLGHATLKAVRGSTPIVIRDRPGIIVSGVTLDAGKGQSTALLRVGRRNSLIKNTHSANPITLHDIYFRVGGPYIGNAKNCLEVNSDNVLIDHTWIWRADHGIETFNSSNGFNGDNERWTNNIGKNGLVVTGSDVTVTGLFVEHFQEHNVIWKGENGRVWFFQNELPYDTPTQKDWMTTNGNVSWTAYKVVDSVNKHELHGGGVYCYNRNNPTIVTQNGFEVPDKGDVKIFKVYTRNLSGPGSISSVINGAGYSVNVTSLGPEYVESFK